MPADVAKTREGIAGALRERREEIERAIAIRVFAISEPPETVDPEYLEGLHLSLGAALEFAFGAIRRGEQRAPDVPTSLLAQARMAARNGVGLDTVIRRYVAGHALLVEYALEVAQGLGTELEELSEALAGQASVLDRLIEAVSEEHRREAATLLRSTSERRAERVRRLLAGEPIDAGELGYELEGFHLGLAGTGPEVEAAVRDLATAVSPSTLTVPMPEGRIWAWFGSRRPFPEDHLAALVERAVSALAPGATLAFGESGEGLEGWRLTHRQALAALPMAERLKSRVVRYAQVGLLASVSADDLLLESLQRIYLAPLSDGRDGGEALRETLRAYLGAGRNISSAAAALGVNRETVRKRVRIAEERIGRTLDECAAELEIALRLKGSHASRSQLRDTPLARLQIGQMSAGAPPF